MQVLFGKACSVVGAAIAIPSGVMLLLGGWMNAIAAVLVPVLVFGLALFALGNRLRRQENLADGTGSLPASADPNTTTDDRPNRSP